MSAWTAAAPAVNICWSAALRKADAGGILVQHAWLVWPSHSHAFACCQFAYSAALSAALSVPLKASTVTLGWMYGPSAYFHSTPVHHPLPPYAGRTRGIPGFTGKQPAPGQSKPPPPAPDTSSWVAINAFDEPRPRVKGIAGYIGHQPPPPRKATQAGVCVTAGQLLHQH